MSETEISRNKDFFYNLQNDYLNEWLAFTYEDLPYNDEEQVRISTYREKYAQFPSELPTTPEEISLVSELDELTLDANRILESLPFDR